MAHWDLCGPFMTLIGNGPIGLIPINVKVQKNSFTGHVGKYTWNKPVYCQRSSTKHHVQSILGQKGHMTHLSGCWAAGSGHVLFPLYTQWLSHEIQYFSIPIIKENAGEGIKLQNRVHPCMIQCPAAFYPNRTHYPVAASLPLHICGSHQD